MLEQLVPITIRALLMAVFFFEYLVMPTGDMFYIGAFCGAFLLSEVIYQLCRRKHEYELL